MKWARTTTMVAAVGAVTFAIVAAGLFENSPSPTQQISFGGTATTTTPTTAPADTTTTTLVAATTTRTPLTAPSISGSLLDGTNYTLEFDSARAITPLGVFGVIMIDLDEGDSRALGILSATPTVSDEARAEGNVLTVPAGDWTVTMRMYRELLPRIAVVAPAGLLPAIRGQAGRGGLPVLRLAPPLRWADDHEVPSFMEVHYEGFTIRRGCDDGSFTCNSRRSVSVVRSGALVLPASIASSAARPRDDPHYLPPGPLAARTDPVVAWTGSEMLVWGGSTAARGFTDGALFDPATSTWRMIAAYPNTGSPRDTQREAVWATDRMFVLDVGGTSEYVPATDSWHRIGPGLEIPRLAAWHDGALFAVGGRSSELLTLSDGTWHVLRTDGERAQSLYSTAAGLVAETTARNCSLAFELWNLDAPVALDVPEALSGGDCRPTNGVVTEDGRLVLAHETGLALLTADRSWVELDAPSWFGQSGDSAVAVGNAVAVTGSVAALVDLASDRWTEIELPGNASSDQAVWTGSEVLMWGDMASATIDAWRWSPPDS